MLRQYQRQLRDKENVADNQTLDSSERSSSKRKVEKEVKKSLYENHFRKNQSEAQLLHPDSVAPRVKERVLQQSHSSINILTKSFKSERLPVKPATNDLKPIVSSNIVDEKNQTEYILRELEKIKRENMELRTMILRQPIYRTTATLSDDPYSLQEETRLREHHSTMSPLLLSQLSTADVKMPV